MSLAARSLLVALARPRAIFTRVKRPHLMGSPNRRYGCGEARMNGKSRASCKQEPGAVRPVVALKRCEGKADCVRVCPENVFEIRRIADVDYRQLGLLHRFKQRVHGMQVAYTPNED